jgi:hypothetical protein
VSGTRVTHAERAFWQWRAATELAEILDAHPGLPLLAWTVSAAGSVLAGHVAPGGDAAAVRAAFGAWRQALSLGEYRELEGSGAVSYLHASRRGTVQVRITATVFDELPADAGERA